MVASLEAQGLKNADSVEDVPDGATLFVRAHGLPTPVYERAKEKNLTVIDATCPMVTKIHVASREAAQATATRSSSSATPTIPRSRARSRTFRAPGASSRSPTVEKLPRGSKIGVVVQSTWSGTGFTDIVKALSEKYYEVRAVNTICTDTHNRQAEAADLAREVEVMVVVGGKTSANTKHLAELSAMNGARAYHIEGPDELQAEWFAGVGVCGLDVGRFDPGLARR